MFVSCRRFVRQGRQDLNLRPSVLEVCVHAYVYTRRDVFSCKSHVIRAAFVTYVTVVLGGVVTIW